MVIEASSVVVGPKYAVTNSDLPVVGLPRAKLRDLVPKLKHMIIALQQALTARSSVSEFVAMKLGQEKGALLRVIIVHVYTTPREVKSRC